MTEYTTKAVFACSGHDGLVIAEWQLANRMPKIRKPIQTQRGIGAERESRVTKRGVFSEYRDSELSTSSGGQQLTVRLMVLVVINGASD